MADVVGLPTGVIQQLLLLRHMASPDGVLAVRAHVLVDGAAPRKRIHHISFIDGEISGIDLSPWASLLQGVRSGDEQWTSIPFENDVLYLEGTASAFLVAREGAVSNVAIDQSIEDEVINEKVTARLRSSRTAHAVSDGARAIVPISNGVRTIWIAIMTLDRTSMTARWDRFCRMKREPACCPDCLVAERSRLPLLSKTCLDSTRLTSPRKFRIPRIRPPSTRR